MIRKITIILVFIVSAYWLHGQQLPQYTQYMFNKIAYNPGYAGAGKGICVGGVIRQQWTGFEETDDQGNTTNVAPETYLVSVHSPIRPLRGGLGLTIMQDQIGHQQDITVNLMYAYQTTWGLGDLGIGVQVGLMNKTIDFSSLKPIDSNDPILASGEESDMYFDAGLGLYYRVPDNYYLGVSVLQLLQTQKEIDVNQDIISTGTTLARQFNITGGYQFGFPGMPEIDVLPSFLIKTDLASMQFDLSTLLRYKNQFWGGLSYRYQDAVSVLAGVFPHERLRIGYSYDVVVSDLSPYQSGTHEITVGFHLGKQESRVLTPRYF
ncbi:MAG: type IX secretion system membrane protein PorP/SprF [Tangfeifania sp.]